jgi:hypothetical protein
VPSSHVDSGARKGPSTDSGRALKGDKAAPTKPPANVRIDSGKVPKQQKAVEKPDTKLTPKQQKVLEKREAKLALKQQKALEKREAKEKKALTKQKAKDEKALKKQEAKKRKEAKKLAQAEAKPCKGPKCPPCPPGSSRNGKGLCVAGFEMPFIRHARTTRCSPGEYWNGIFCVSASSPRTDCSALEAQLEKEQKNIERLQQATESTCFQSQASAECSQQQTLYQKALARLEELRREYQACLARQP